MDSEKLFPEPERFLYCDGASKGNPGPASIGAVIYGADPESVPDTEELLQISQAIGSATNNVAEYRSLIEGLKALKESLGADFSASRIQVRMDSQLVIRQIEGQYKVKNENLKPLHKEALSVLKAASSFQVQHIPREKNKRADALANEALK